MLFHLFFFNQNQKQLSVVFIAALVGTVFLFLSVHYLVKINQFGETTETLAKNVFIVQKKVQTASLLGLSKRDFSATELVALQKESFVESFQAVVSNNFDVSFQTNDPLVPYFRSDVFIQTVDATFLDVQTENWNWKVGHDFVPIILPRDFLVMLNAFMNANGMPQIPETLAMQVNFRMNLRQNDKKQSFDAKIVGFTSQIPAIIVPRTFMEYGQKHFSTTPLSPITQIMIATNKKEFGKVEHYLDQHGLESKQSDLLIGRLKSVLFVFVSIITAIASLSVCLAILMFMQYLQLIVSRNRYEIKTLIALGYEPKKIKKVFFRYFISVFSVVLGLSFIAFFVFRFFLDEMFQNAGLFIDTKLSFPVFIVLIAVFGLAFLFFRIFPFFSEKIQNN